MMLPISVETWRRRDGRSQPSAFTYRGRRILIRDIGRQWEQEGVFHYLVMDQLGEIYELAFDQSGEGWLLVRGPQDLGPMGRAV
jgi:hypothetical protein